MEWIKLYKTSREFNNYRDLEVRVKQCDEIAIKISECDSVVLKIREIEKLFEFSQTLKKNPHYFVK
jgi:hypothetical protein